MSDDVTGCESSLVRENQLDPRVRLNRTGRDYPRNACVHQLIEEQARRTPDRVAASFDNENLTYAELERRANQLANYLLRMGVGPDVLVGISLARSLDMVVACLGILKAGGAYVLLNPSYPKDRLAFMLNDSQLRYLVTEEHLRPLLPLHAGATICLDSEKASLAAEATVITNNRTGPRNLSYVLYTSGSTGNPKGVQIEHRSAVNLLMSMRERPGLREDDVLVAVTTLSFDIAGLELYLPLMVGARVVIVSHDVACDGERLLSTLERCGATVMQATPVTWRLLIEAGWSSKRMKVLVGGEALPRELARQLTKRGNSVWNLYGPTETTIWSSVYRVGDEVTATVPIGQPIANTQMYILDSDAQLVQVGDTGQLYIGGDGLARGYLNRPELNAEKFVSSPFRPGTKLYATGDLARYLPSGDIEFLGRMDHQVKIRGFRVELGEVESALEERPGIRQAIVMARNDPSGAKRLVAYIVAQAGEHPSSSALRNALRSKLPAYMIPALYVPLDKMPLTANGKVDRAALPEPPDGSLEDSITAAPPADPLETQIAHVWEKVLGHKPVGIHDNFFDLGGDSFLAVKVVQRIEKICGQRLPIAAFFRAPTVA